MSRWSELIESRSGALALNGCCARTVQPLCTEIDKLQKQITDLQQLCKTDVAPDLLELRRAKRLLLNERYKKNQALQQMRNWRDRIKCTEISALDKLIERQEKQIAGLAQQLELADATVEAYRQRFGELREGRT